MRKNVICKREFLLLIIYKPPLIEAFQAALKYYISFTALQSAVIFLLHSLLIVGVYLHILCTAMEENLALKITNKYLENK